VIEIAIFDLENFQNDFAEFDFFLKKAFLCVAQKPKVTSHWIWATRRFLKKDTKNVGQRFICH
jgi:hypothetical protein